jgi:RNA polymerase sigma factor, sigma-70 family
MSNLSDENLASQAARGNTESSVELCVRYATYVKQLSHRFFLVGGDTEDLVQEGMLALFKASTTYDETRNASFKTFATNCIRCRLIDAIKKDGNSTSKTLNGSSSLDDIFDTPAPDDDPLVTLLGEEAVDIINTKIAEILTSSERRIFDLYLEGLSYKEIGGTLKLSTKKVDNSLQQIKRKLKKALS